MIKAITITNGTKTLEMRSAMPSIGVRLLLAPLISRMIWLNIVLDLVRSATISSCPWPLTVPAMTRLPICLSIVELSPVIIDSLTADSPPTTRPSIGITSSGRTINRSPSWISSAGMSTMLPPLIKCARRGRSFTSWRTDCSVRSAARFSIHLPNVTNANNRMTVSK